MSTTNGDPAVGTATWQEEREALSRRIADLEAQLAEVTSQRDEARAALHDYQQMYHDWNVYGTAPPRECELEEARNNPHTLEQLIAELEERSRTPSGGA